MVDLHTHSNESDGELTPTELINLAVNSKLDAIALTDHDTVAGIEEAHAQAVRKGIRFIPGVETNVEFAPGEFHLLGLDLKADRMIHIERFLEDIRRCRVKRNLEMIQCMQREKLDISWDILAKLAGGEVIGRLHFARWLVDAGWAKDIPDAFKRWLSSGCPCHVEKSRPTLEDTIEVIHQAGGRTVLAHPKTLFVSWSRLEQLVVKWKEMGLDGIEALHSGATWSEAMRLTKLASSCNLFITGGSDFHGYNRPDRRLGYGPNGMKLKGDFLTAFEND